MLQYICSNLDRKEVTKMGQPTIDELQKENKALKFMLDRLMYCAFKEALDQLQRRIGPTLKKIKDGTDPNLPKMEDVLSVINQSSHAAIDIIHEEREERLEKVRKESSQG